MKTVGKMATDDQRKRLEKWLKYCLRMRKKQRWRFADLAGLVILWQSLKHKGSWDPVLAPLLVGKQALLVSSNPFKSSIHDRQLCSLQLDFAFVGQTHFPIHRLKPLIHIDPHLIICSQNRHSTIIVTIDRRATDKSISISVALTSVSYDLIIQIRLRPSLQWTLHRHRFRRNHQHRHHNYSR